MKCAACSYRFNEPKFDGVNYDYNNVESDGDKQFIKLINTFHRKDEDGSLDEVYLFACPQCGTVRMEKW